MNNQTQLFSLFQNLPRDHLPRRIMHARFPLLLGNAEDLLHERGIEIGHKTVRFWWNRLPAFRRAMD
jgi:putative transposase